MTARRASPARAFARRTHEALASLGVDPLDWARRWRGLPVYVRNAMRYRRSADGERFPLAWSEARYTSYDRYAPAGTGRGHYFHQDLWAARSLHDRGVRDHVDVGSRVDGFVAHVLPFCRVEYVDIRPLDASVPNLSCRQGSILDLPYASGELHSLSCLHVIEHIGLGRYGDPVQPDGYVVAARELARVLAPGGVLLLGTPVGRERVCFDAHRVFDPQTIRDAFGTLSLREFSLIDDAGAEVRVDATFEEARQCEYGCGLFAFERPLGG